MATLGATNTTTQYQMPDGWISANETWTYASASTFTISGVDVTAKLAKGTFLRFKQGAGYKYAVVASVTFSTDTTVTIIVNTDYTIANAAITDNDFSYSANPQGFPHSFTYAPTWTASANPAIGNGTLTGEYVVYGLTIRASVLITMGSTTTYGTGEWSIGLPLTSANNTVCFTGAVYALDSGTAHFAGIAKTEPNTASFSVFPSASSGSGWGATVPFTWATNDRIRAQLDYTF